MTEHNSKLTNLDSTTDKTVASINQFNDKVTELRTQRMADPDTLGDKFLKIAIPGLVGLIGGKLFQLVWNAATSRLHPSSHDDAQDQQQGLLMSIMFAAASAAFGTLLTRASDRGAESIVHRLQNRRER